MTKPTTTAKPPAWEALILAAANGAEPPESNEQQAGQLGWSQAALQSLATLKRLLRMQGKATKGAVLEATLARLRDLSQQQQSEKQQVAASAGPKLATMESFQVLAAQVKGLERRSIIEQARADYASDSRVSRLCHESAFVSQALRDAGHEPLADGELK